MRFTEDERKTLELAAGDRPLGAYIRWLIFGDEIPKNRTRGKKPVKDQKELAKLLAMFGQSRISSNINQLAKAGKFWLRFNFTGICKYLCFCTL